ncbi:MAG TPA: ATPase domain-containing protein [Thermoplasmata archaeon]|nr:ATPase domain-containing protein [Thermoplasmata archaeon]
MSEPAELANGRDAVPDDPAVHLGKQLGLSPRLAERLVSSGHDSPEKVRQLSDTELGTLGFGPEDIQRLRTRAEAQSPDPPGNGAPAVERPRVSGEKIVERWMDSVRKTERPKRRAVRLTQKDSTDVLKKWVEGDDHAMEAWIHASETARPAPAAPRPPEPIEAPSAPSPPAGTSTTVPAPASPLPAQVLEREETVVRWLTGLLDRVKSDQFDPRSILAEVQDLQRQLFEERSKRKTLEDEIEHVKRGSIAVIKYVRSREAKTREQAIQAKDAEIADLRLRLLQGGATLGPNGEIVETRAPGAPAGAPVVDEMALKERERQLKDEFNEREQEYIERETELRRRIVQLEGDIRSLKNESDQARDRETLLKGPAETLPQTLQDQMAHLEQRERDLTVRENELRTRFEEIKIGTDELDRKRSPLAFKEKELSSWEQQLQMTKQALEIEARRIEQLRASVVPADRQSTKEKQLDDLKNELTHREEELRAKETFLNQKMEELEQLQNKTAEFEADRMHTEVTASVQESKVKSGVRRLDDLLFGGYPIGSQLLLNGPTHTGKDVLARLFVAEGLKMGLPAIWVVTDKTYLQIREEMTALFPPYPQFESRGLLRYVDLYSKSLGVQQAETNVRLLSPTEKGAIEQLTTFTNQFSQDLKERFGSYRLVFESVSTVTAYLDTNTTFRFLQPFVGRRKMDGAAAYYILETGMHTDADLQTLEHMMDGSINLKVDQLKTFLSVKGIGDAQSRAWIGYTFSKKSFSLGSFSLDHIR